MVGKILWVVGYKVCGPCHLGGSGGVIWVVVVVVAGGGYVGGW